MSTTISREQISAVFDGEWTDAGGDAAACAAVRAVASDPQARGDWLVYAQIGDCLRTPDLQLLPREEDFLARINAAIAQEPVVIAPRAVQAAQAAGVVAHRRPHWSTRIAAGMAAVAGVAVMAWVALPALQEGNTTAGQVATGAGVGAAPQVTALQPVSVNVPLAAPGATNASTRQVAVVQADLQVPVSGSAPIGVVAVQPVSVGADLSMAEYLLAHQQMAGGMMPSVPAVLRGPLVQTRAVQP